MNELLQKLIDVGCINQCIYEHGLYKIYFSFVVNNFHGYGIWCENYILYGGIICNEQGDIIKGIYNNEFLNIKETSIRRASPNPSSWFNWMPSQQIINKADKIKFKRLFSVRKGIKFVTYAKNYNNLHSKEFVKKLKNNSYESSGFTMIWIHPENNVEFDYVEKLIRRNGIQKEIDAKLKAATIIGDAIKSAGNNISSAIYNHADETGKIAHEIEIGNAVQNKQLDKLNESFRQIAKKI